MYIIIYYLNNLKTYYQVNNILNETILTRPTRYSTRDHGLLQSVRNVGFPETYNFNYTRLIWSKPFLPFKLIHKV